MKIRPHIDFSRSDLVLPAIFIAASVAMLKSSEDPILNPLSGTPLAGWLTAMPTGNQITFDLSVGLVSTIFTYFLLVRFPEAQKKRRIVSHLSQTFRETKINLVRSYLSIIGLSYDSDLPKELLDQSSFRSYFQGDRWHTVANKINDYWLQEILAELEILHNELQFALGAIEANSDSSYSKLKSIAAWTIRARNIDIRSDDLKSFLRSLWELHTGFSFISGYTGRDAIDDQIRQL